MSDWIERDKYIEQLVEKLGKAQAKLIEDWLRQHWTHKPGPQIIHSWDRSMKGRCGCGETVIFKVQLVFPPDSSSE